MRSQLERVARLFLPAALLLMSLTTCNTTSSASVPTAMSASITPRITATVAPPPTVAASSTPRPTQAPAPDVTIVTAPNALGYDPRFSVAARQAEEVAIIVGFLRAYNRGHLDDALAFLDDAVQVSDCDYQAVRPVGFMGKLQATEWLRQRIADHDQLILKRILNENPDDELVAGVEYARRTSTTLQQLGFADGITPKSATKVVFTTDPMRIGAFANGPIGGDPSSCQATR
jgi:hypothetical protein